MIRDMIVDGRAIADDLLGELKTRIDKLGCSPKLAVIMAGDDPVSERFLNMKRKRAEEVGIEVSIHRFRERVATEEIVDLINSLEETSIIVQLPLPENIEMTRVLDSVPEKEDVDVLATRSNIAYLEEKLTIFPPVTGAIREILHRHKISLEGKKVVVVGRGHLVGKPTIIWLKHLGADLHEVDNYTDEEDRNIFIKEADVLITGAGSAHTITPDMVKDGVVIIDAGTSESKGNIVGDVHPGCAEKASLFTPVPGGVGPITVAVLLRNVVDYSIERAKLKEVSSNGVGT